MICIAGKNAIAVNAIYWLLAHGYTKSDLLVCVNRTDTGANLWQPSLLYHAQRNGIPVKTLKEVQEIEDILFISLEYDQLLKPELFRTSRLFNIHFSLLPAYKGMYTSVFPLLNGEKEAGVTLHIIDKGIDTGHIIAKQAFSLDANCTSFDLYQKYLVAGFEIFKNNFQSLVNGAYTSYPQALNESTYYSKSTLNFADIKIDLNATSWHIHNQIRAFSFRDYQLPIVLGYPIYRSEMIAGPTNFKPGTVLFENEEYLIINTIDAQIKLYKDQEDVLFKAAANGDLDTILRLHSMNYTIDIKNKKGWNVLIVAAYHERMDLVKWLVGHGFDVNDTNHNGTTVLMYAMTAASKTGTLDLMQYLIEMGADLHKKDDHGKTLLDYSIKYGHTDVIAFVRSHFIL